MIDYICSLNFSYIIIKMEITVPATVVLKIKYDAYNMIPST